MAGFYHTFARDASLRRVRAQVNAWADMKLGNVVKSAFHISKIQSSDMVFFENTTNKRDI